MSQRVLRTAAIAAVAAALLAVTATPARAGEPDSSDADARTIVARGVARVQGTPDLLTMTLGVTSRGRTVGEALQRNTEASRDVTAVLLDGGVDRKDIQTSSFSIGPVQDDRANVTAYEVSNLVTVRLRDLETAGELIDAAAAAGGDDVVMRGVHFGFDDTSDLVARARDEAVARARTQAEQLATAAGVELGEVRTISESSHDPGPVLEAPTRAPAADVAIEPGTEELTVVVTIVYTIR